MQATKIATWSIPEAEVIVGENGTQVSFEEWAVPSDVEDNSTMVVAVATMDGFASEGSKLVQRCVRSPELAVRSKHSNPESLADEKVGGSAIVGSQGGPVAGP